mmetsp:Transcript_99148/g.300955  ORF Transcript_99148/g.300955 Transcript_99148/m.300955 type:complete len:210 (+) Transcript_99148:1637-2266(+)
MHQHAFWRRDSDGLKTLLVRHWQHDGLDQLLDLLVQATDVTVLVGWPLVNLHGLHPRVVLGRQLVKHQVGVLVDSDEVVRAQVLSLHEAYDWQEDGLPRRGLHDEALAIAHHVDVLGCAILVVLIGFELEDLGNIRYKVWKLAVELDLLLVVLGLLLNGLHLVMEALLLALHHTDIILQQPNSLLNLLIASALQFVCEDIILAPDLSTV